MASINDEPLVTRHGNLAPRLADEEEEMPGEHRPEEMMTGSQTETIGGGGPEAHNPSPVRATEDAGDTGRRRGGSRR